jgi:hypothetical protein
MKQLPDFLSPRGLLTVVVAVIAFVRPTAAHAQVDLSLNFNVQSPADFYGPLEPYGRWLDVPRYGRCWQPVSLPPDWQPYTIGQWEWTDAGWYWQSDEPWAWATYHYGQWIMDPVYGWMWVPGTQWAPAWVVWREAPDYIGWAPCGPGGAVFATTPFIFVDVHHFHDRLNRRELVFNDRRILGRSRFVGGFQTETRDWGGSRRRIAINRGPGVAPIERATGSRFVQKPVRELARQTPPPNVNPRSPNTFTTRERNTQPAWRQTAPSSTVTEPRIYREAPQTTPAPTGRQEQRIYREAPTQRQSPPAAQIPQPSRQVPAQRAPTIPTPPAPVQTPQQRALPPTGPERGRREVEVPRRAEPQPRAVQPNTQIPQAPPPVVPPQPQERNQGRQRDRDGQ